jgi:hypothetical protein
LSRQFAVPAGEVTALVDVLNVTNAGQELQQQDLSGLSLNLRLPVAIQTPRLVRVGFRYAF